MPHMSLCLIQHNTNIAGSAVGAGNAGRDGIRSVYIQSCLVPPHLPAILHARSIHRTGRAFLPRAHKDPSMSATTKFHLVERRHDGKNRGAIKTRGNHFHSFLPGFWSQDQSPGRTEGSMFPGSCCHFSHFEKEHWTQMTQWPVTGEKLR